MKSGRILLITLFSLFCVSLNAQVFVGGNFGFNTSNDKADVGATTTKKISDYSFSFSPKAGIFFSEKFAVGVDLNISFSGHTSGVTTETVTNSSSVGFSPFVRYYAVKWNKFSLFGQGNMGLELSKTSYKTGATKSDGPKTTELYFSIHPGLSYDISEKLSLETSLNILSFGLNVINTKNGTAKEINTGFNIGAGLSNIVTIGAITVGAIFKF